MKETFGKRLALLTGPMRVPFLVLAVACALLGWGVADWTAGPANALHVVLVFIGAVCAHIGVNALNEWHDFKTGLDAATMRTPFSGGSGTLQARPDLAGRARNTGLIACAITALIGVYFLIVWGWGIVPVGILGLFVIAAYTPWFLRSPFLSLISPGLGFGTLMVTAAAFALSGAYTWTAFFASLVPFFLVNDLLLFNQFPDVEADRSVGRRNYPIVAGLRVSAHIYGLFLLLNYVSIAAGVVLGYLPVFSLLGLLTLALAVPAYIGSLRYPTDIPKLIPYLGYNVLVNILTPALVAVGLFLG